MAQTFTGRKRVRKVFGHVREVGPMPNLIEVQKASYDQFLMMDAPKAVKEGVSKEEADKIKAALEKVGAKVELK